MRSPVLRRGEGIPGSLSSARFGAACVALAATLWGWWPFWVRGEAGGAATATIAFIVASVLGLPFALREGCGRRRGQRAWLLLLLLAVLDAGNAWCYFRALAEGVVAPATLSHYLAPVLVALGAPPLLGEPRGRRTPIALALALAGTAALVLAGNTSGLANGAAARALALGTASAFFYAGNVLVSKRLSADFTPVELMSFHSVPAALMLLPLTGLPAPALMVRPAIGGLVSTLIAGVIYYAGLRRIPAERAGVLAYIEPLVAVLVAWMIYGEQPPLVAALGGAMVILGGVLVATDAPART